MTVKGIKLGCIHVDDYVRGLEFYSNLLGFVPILEMGTGQCFGSAGGAQFYLEGGNLKHEVREGETRTSFVFEVDSVGTYFDKFKKAGVQVLQSSPLEIGEDEFWFQFRDPSGNILEIVGGV